MLEDRFPMPRGRDLRFQSPYEQMELVRNLGYLCVLKERVKTKVPEIASLLEAALRAYFERGVPRDMVLKEMREILSRESPIEGASLESYLS